jgi:transposase, IS5 family
MRFLGLGLADPVPDVNTIWTFREALKRADAVDGLFRQFDDALRASGFLAMSGQIVDATIVAVGPYFMNGGKLGSTSTLVAAG